MLGFYQGLKSRNEGGIYRIYGLGCFARAVRDQSVAKTILMALLPIFRLGQSREEIQPPSLTSYAPSLSLTGLQLGIDNLRHDVHLSPKFVEQARLHIARLITRHGTVEGLVAAEAPARAAGNYFVGGSPVAKVAAKSQLPDLKPLLAELHVSALNRAKTASNPSMDMVARLAVIKFLRTELNAQFAQVLERCRMMLKSYEGVRQQKAMEYRERVAGFQVSKKIIQRKTAQELFTTLREIEKETLARMRRSLFGSGSDAEYRLFQNPLIFTEDGRDNYLNAEHYVLLGNFDRDPDRFAAVRSIIWHGYLFAESPSGNLGGCAGTRKADELCDRVL